MSDQVLSPKRNYYVVALTLVTFLVMSFLTHVTGPLIADVMWGINPSLAMVALLPFASFIAYGVVSVPAGVLKDPALRCVKITDKM